MTAFTAKSTAEQVAKHFSNAINSKSGTITFNWPLPQLALTIATVLVTGVTQGTLGAEVALRISHHQPANLVLAGRSLSALNITKSTIEAANPVSVTLLELDLASQASVRAAARTANSYPFTIDVLINNAGIMAVPYTKTAEGLERQWATNHIGHFLFTNLIMPKLRASRSTARIVNVSSAGHKRSDIRWDDVGFGGGERYDKWAAYGQTKTANMLFSVALAKLGGVESFSCYPGRVRTNLVNSIPLEELVAAGWLHPDGSLVEDPKLKWKTIPEGAATIVAAAFDPELAKANGGYVVDSQLANDEAALYALDEKAAVRLWKLSEKIIGEKFLDA